MVTFEITLTEEQAWRLFDHANRQGQTVSERVAANDAQVAEWEWEQRREIAERAKAIAGTMDFGAADVAEKHDDHYVEAILESKGVGEQGSTTEAD